MLSPHSQQPVRIPNLSPKPVIAPLTSVTSSYIVRELLFIELGEGWKRNGYGQLLWDRNEGFRAGFEP